MTTRPDTAYDRLREVRTAEDLLRYFIDQLDWPLEDEYLLEDPEDLMFEWDLEELGIPYGVRRPVERLRQVRPFTETQPWGIFFVELTAQRLLIGQIRKILNKLVTRRRTTARDPNQRSWALDNLIFVVTTGSGDSTELHLLVFFDVDGRTEFRCLTWRPTDSTSRLRRLAQELLPHLAWPHEEEDTEAWRTAWREPFTQQPGEVIKTASRLVDRMSRTAVDLRRQIRQALAAEAGEGPFTGLKNDIRQQLVADVDEERFSDMCAQTLVYGLLGSRVSDPDGFGATPVLSAVPLSNPFLSAFFEHVHGEAVELDLEGSGLEQLTADLRVSNVEAILDDFGSTAKGGDPVIHFYEEFLKKYDSQMRADAGAFFTPEPIVAFMVRGVDHLLRTRFGLEAGVADPTTWGQVAEQLRFDVPEGVDPHKPFISMVDPATGTGTFLVHWLRQAKQSFADTHPDESWRRHLAETVLPMVHAFELMLAPYTIAHLKLALRLHDELLPTDAAKLLLTDTLAHDPPQLRLDGLDDPVAAEGRAAALLKTSERFTVVIGNPPYDREQHDVGATGKRKGGVVRHGAAGFEPLIKDLTEPMSQAGLGVHIKNLYNDYVYFWRWAVWQATELPPGPGIVAFITASSYLDGISMGGVRSLLRHAFDELIIVDLGGEGRGALVEENVFDIRTPVAIAFGVRKQVSDEPCTTRYTRILGTRQEKFDQLRNLSIEDVTIDVSGEGLEALIPRSDADYWSWPSVADLFPWRHSGAQFKRTWPIGPTTALLNKRWNTLVTAIPHDRTDLLRDTGFRTILSTPKPLLGSGPRLESLRSLDRGDQPEGIEPYGYRSFDRQWVIADNRVADRPRPDLWRVRGRGQLFLTTLTSTKLGGGPALTVTPYVPDMHHFSGRGAKNVIPLYRDRDARQPNLPERLLETLGETVGRHLTAHDLVAYIHALLGTSAFSERFTDELAEMAGPVHVPITSDLDLFNQAIRLGRELLWYHTWGERFTPDPAETLPQGNTDELSPIDGYPETFRYRPEDQTLQVGSGLFGPVSQEVWNFEVSGLRVLDSWLGYRKAKGKGRKSSDLDDIRPRTWVFTDELRRLIAILQHTIDLTPTANQLLDDIIAGPLIHALDLPEPTNAERKAPPQLTT